MVPCRPAVCMSPRLGLHCLVALTHALSHLQRPTAAQETPLSQEAGGREGEATATARLTRTWHSCTLLLPRHALDPRLHLLPSLVWCHVVLQYAVSLSAWPCSVLAPSLMPFPI